MKSATLHADQIFRPEDCLHFTRAILSPRPPRLAHDHDFYEVFWLHNGRAKHVINGQAEKLTEGDLVFVRPSDRHSLQGKGEETHLVNIAFRAETIAALTRHNQLGGQFFWSTGTMPQRLRRNPRDLADLSRAALRLETGARTPLAAEAFLLPLLSDLAGHDTALPDATPAWLAEACHSAHSREVFQDGSAGLVRMTGKTHAHVSRSMQRFLGQSPSQFINDIRMSHAALTLTGSADPLPEIAAEIGIPNLSHFHKLFKAQYGLTPADYRRQFQKNVVQPG